ncbi:MAG: hypothetical protein JRJ38_10585 [Deltaproteobacteria bacterium]|nr:hypothetical protein [Deltaproteobacteria bacterium]
MGGRFREYGGAKRKAQTRKTGLREKDTFKNYARSARTYLLICNVHSISIIGDTIS